LSTLKVGKNLYTPEEIKVIKKAVRDIVIAQEE
jgi:hypothetical protein